MLNLTHLDSGPPSGQHITHPASLW